jgi:AcrR family transcriptional regulator
MFTKKVKPAGNPAGSAEQPPRGRGRPPGPTLQGLGTRHKLYGTAIDLIGTKGYDQTTMRDVADAAGVSVGLLYRYFPNKRAVVLALYDELSLEQQSRCADMAKGLWRDRFLAALDASLAVLKPHRRTLSALIPVMVSAEPDGLFGSATTFSRRRVQQIFQDAVVGAKDAPRGELAAALGRLLYLVHLAVILWWLLDKSPNQRATAALVALIKQILPMAALTMKIRRVGDFIMAGDKLFDQALLQDGGPEASPSEA